MKQKILDKFNEVMEKIDYTSCRCFSINQVYLNKHECYIYVSLDFNKSLRNYHLRFNNISNRMVISSYFPKKKHYIKNI